MTYVTDELLHKGRSYGRGEKVPDLDNETEARLLDSGQLTKTKPAPLTVADPNAPAPVSLADFSDEDLLAEVESRGLDGSESDSNLDWSKKNKTELEAEVESRNLQVEGTGKDGAVTKDDLVAALTEDNAAHGTSAA